MTWFLLAATIAWWILRKYDHTIIGFHDFKEKWDDENADYVEEVGHKENERIWHGTKQILTARIVLMLAIIMVSITFAGL